MSAALLVWLSMAVVLLAYVLTGGADFGGGVWDLLATKPRKYEQRVALRDAIAPVWEANHVWLIIIIVMMFAVFPRAFAVVGISLHVPIALALIGIVLRGSAFVFRAYGLASSERRRRWGRVFATASTATPVLLGMTLAAVTSGSIRVVDGEVTTGYFAGWLTPFAILVGLLTLGLFAMLAAVYMCLETRGTTDLQADFRLRALASQVTVIVLASLTLWRARADAPYFYEQMTTTSWGTLLHIAVALSAVTTAYALYARRFRFARAMVVVQVAAVVMGWGLAMAGFLIVPDITLDNAGTADALPPVVLGILGAGSLVLAPSLWYLYRVFKKTPAQ